MKLSSITSRQKLWQDQKTPTSFKILEIADLFKVFLYQNFLF